MRLGGFGFLLGILWSAYQPEYRWPGLVLLLVTVILPGIHRHIVISIMAGMVWLWIYLLCFSPEPIPLSIDGKTVLVTGEVVSVPRAGSRSTRFDFAIRDFQDQDISWRGRVRLSWYYPMHKLEPGQLWNLSIKLKPAHGFANPGGFDYERWLFSRGITATGYVKNSAEASLIASEYSLDRFRQYLGETIRNMLPEQTFSGVLVALVTGDRQYISRDHWVDMSRTGTTHLMAISGLHIGLVYGIFFWFGRFAWQSVTRLCLFRPAQDIAVIAGLIAAVIYAALAGFSIPTQRAIVMLSVVTLAMLTRRLTVPLDVLQSALVLVLIMDPLSILSAGFWLSFMAVVIILLMLQQTAADVSGSRIPFFGLMRMQWFLVIGMLPLSSLLFNQVSILAPIMNMLAVPVVGFIVVPLSLAGAAMALILPQAAALLMQAAHLLLEWLWLLLDAASNSAYAVVYPASQPWWLYILVSAGVILLLFRSAAVYRIAGILLILPLFINPANTVKHSEFQVDFLDVGQGLAVVVRTSNHVLLYDTGFASDGGFDIGQRVIAPYLWHQGIDHLDRIILSHDDLDHTGGYQFLVDEFSINHLSVMPGSRYWSDSERVSICRAGDSWRWDGIRFRFLHPGPTASAKENDRSCVLHISGPGGSVLLTGDIEQYAEVELVNRFRDRLAADVLLAPHHGSATSSSADFIAHVKPGEVIYSAGFRNRFGFPRPEITRRYDDHGVLQHSTARTGMVRFYFQTRPGGYQRMFYRQQQQNFWQQAAEH